MLEIGNVRSDVFLLILGELIVSFAVVVNLGVWDGFGLAISQGESFIEVWAMRQTVDGRSPIWILGLNHLLSQLLAVVIRLRIWDTLGLTIGEGHSLVKVWAIFKRIWMISQSNILLLNHLIIRFAVIIDLWVWDGFGLAVIQGESFIEVWAVWQTVDGWSPVWILLLNQLLTHLVVRLAVIVNLWVWNSFSLSISKSESLVKIRAVRKRIN